MAEAKTPPSLPRRNTIQEIKRRYVNDDLNAAIDPYLDDYAKEYGIPVSELQRAWSRGRWAELRQRAKERELLLSDAEIERQNLDAPVDLVTALPDLVATSVNLVQGQLPMVLAELQNRMTTMSNGEILSLLKELNAEKSRVLKLAQKAGGLPIDPGVPHASTGAQNAEDDELNAALSMKADIVQFAKRERVSTPESHERAEEREEETAPLFADLDEKIAGIKRYDED